MSSSVVQPFAVPIQPGLVSMRVPRHSFVLLNSRKKKVTTMFTGTIVEVPPVHLVGLRPELDADGEPIPGSLIVEDIYMPLAEFDDEVCVFNAIRAVRHILGLNEGNDGSAVTASSPYALAGLSLLPRRPTKEMWQQVAREGADRAFLADVDRAYKYMQSEEESATKRKAMDMPPLPPNGVEFARHRFILEQYQAMTKKQVEEELAPHELSDMEAELELDLIAREIAQGMIERTVKNAEVDKNKLLDELLTDPRIRKAAEKRWQIRKRGSQPIPDDKLAAAVESGAASTEDLE